MIDRTRLKYDSNKSPMSLSQSQEVSTDTTRGDFLNLAIDLVSIDQVLQCISSDEKCWDNLMDSQLADSTTTITFQYGHNCPVIKFTDFLFFLKSREIRAKVFHMIISFTLNKISKQKHNNGS